MIGGSDCFHLKGYGFNERLTVAVMLSTGGSRSRRCGSAQQVSCL
jgi:hypothetical protein